MTSCSPRYTETTKQGKTAVCLRFRSNSVLARFLWKMVGAASLLAAPPPLSPSASADVQTGPSGILLGSEPAFSWRGSCFGSLPGLWSPERFFFLLGEVLGLSCCQRVEACSAFSPWKTPGCGIALPPALAPFRIFSFLLGESGLGQGPLSFRTLGMSEKWLLLGA